MQPASKVFSQPAIVVAANLLLSGVFKRDVNAQGKSMISLCTPPVSLPAAAFKLDRFATSRTLSLLCPACKPLQLVKRPKFDFKNSKLHLFIASRLLGFCCKTNVVRGALEESVHYVSSC